MAYVPPKYNTTTLPLLNDGANELVLAPSVRRNPVLSHFDNNWAARLFGDSELPQSGIPIENIMVYLVDIVPMDVLYYLAEQWDVLGLKGWDLCDTDEEKRTLVKGAIELHRYKGTPWAIIEALKRVGFGESTIDEGVGYYYDGGVIADGSATYGGYQWAQFRVNVDLGNGKGLDTQSLSRIKFMIKEYKNTRSHLASLSFKASLEDNFNEKDGVIVETPIDQLTGGIQATIATITENVGNTYYYDGTLNYDGTGYYREEVAVEDLDTQLTEQSTVEYMPNRPLSYDGTQFFDGVYTYSGEDRAPYTDSTVSIAVESTDGKIIYLYA